MKKLIFAITLFFTIFSGVLAQTDYLTAKKISIKNESIDGLYDINIKVPGNEKSAIEGYNVVIVIDGSTSMKDSKWTNLRNAVLNATDILLPNKDGNNANKVALITFGIDYHINTELTSNKEDIENILPVTYDNSLLKPGRSSTNVEVGFKGAYEYLNSITDPNDKEHTYVLFLSDAEVNASEILVDWPTTFFNNTYWVNYGMNYTNMIINYIDHFNLTDYPEFLKTYKENITKDIDNKDTYFKELINSYFKYINNGNELEEMSISNIERLVTTTSFSSDYELNYGLIELGYTIMMPQINIFDRKTSVERAINEANRLNEIANIYTIKIGTNNYDFALKIMNPEFEGSNNYDANTIDTHFSKGYYTTDTDMVKLNEILSNLVSELTYTNYINSKVIDYTSKWVIPKDINGDGIFNELDIMVTNNGQKVDANINVEKLSKEEIDKLNDPEVKGNTSNDIYKITWYITGTFKYEDNYILSYQVDVDTLEESFEFNKDYKANGDTTLTYDIIQTKKDEIEVIEKDVVYNILVPLVKATSGNLIVNYITDTGDILKDPVKSTKQVGTEYKTIEESFEGYQLLTVKGNETGKYIDGTIEVTYVYTNAFGNVDYEEIPPHTDATITINIPKVILYYKKEEFYI